MQALLTVEQLSTRIHKSVASIRSDATRNPHSLPPICRLPNTKRLLWRAEDVEQWIARHVAGCEPTATTHQPLPEKRRRGRPTKTESLAKQRTDHDTRG